MCGSDDSELVTPAYLKNKKRCDFQEIRICRTCGLVYKNPNIPELTGFEYDIGSWGDGKEFGERLSGVASVLSQQIKTNLKEIIEIGPGPGWLAKEIHEKWPDARMTLFEPAVEVARIAKKNVPGAAVIPATFDESGWPGVADLVLMCGVDYLLPNIRRTMRKVWLSMADDGVIYIERNVFVESESFVWLPIQTQYDLIGVNSMMSTWFNFEQYREWLKMFFYLLSWWEYTVGGSTIHGFLCRKRQDPVNYWAGKSWYRENKLSLSRLQDDPDPEQPMCKPWYRRMIEGSTHKGG